MSSVSASVAFCTPRHMVCLAPSALALRVPSLTKCATPLVSLAPESNKRRMRGHRVHAVDLTRRSTRLPKIVRDEVLPPCARLRYACLTPKVHAQGVKYKPQEEHRGRCFCTSMSMENCSTVRCTCVDSELFMFALYVGISWLAWEYDSEEA